MKKVIHTEILDLLRPYSVRMRYLFIELYLHSDAAGIVDLNENKSLLKVKGKLKGFKELLTFVGDIVIINDAIKWQYCKLRENHNPHSKAWKCLSQYAGLYYNRDLNKIMA